MHRGELWYGGGAKQADKYNILTEGEEERRTQKLQHQNTRFEDHPEPRTDHPGHADLGQASRTAVDMSSDSPLVNQERPTSRRRKSENRFYNFLSRSRSHSRSKDAHSNPPPKHLPQIPPQDPLLTTDSQSSKPPTRIPSRPLSTNTVTTNTTITPTTYKTKKRRPADVPLPQPPAPEPIEHECCLPLRSATPKPTNTRRKLHEFFALSLTSPKKTSFRAVVSHPSSSRASFDVPPLPTRDGDSNTLSQSRKSFSRPQSPTAFTKVKLSATDVKLSSPPEGKAPTSTTHGPFSGSGKPTITVSAPLRRPSQHRSTKSEGKGTVQTDPWCNKETRVRGPGESIVPPPPHIICTPATPERTPISTMPSPTQHGPRKLSVDSSDYLAKRGASANSDVSKRAGITRTESAKAQDRDATAQRQTSRMGNSTAFVRSTKHGSFDFERPAWSETAVAVQRSGSGATTNSTVSALSRQAVRLPAERDSSFGPGLAGVGTLQREISIKRGKEQEEQVRERETERKKLQQKKKQTAEKVQQDATTVETNHTGGSTSTAGTGHSSSLGRATGKRSALSGRTGSGSGLSKLIGITEHPRFDFEPPIPSPPPRNANNTTDPNFVPVAPLSGERTKRPVKTRSKEQKRSVDEQLPFHIPSSIGHRSALKGRSLDLGLGFAWAPSSVREDALLPSTALRLGRSFSQTSNAKTTSSRRFTASSQAKSNARHAVYEADDQHDTSKLAKEVNAVFKESLDDEGYRTFKKYVHQFDAHEIPFDGPTGIITRVEGLLSKSSTLKPNEKSELMNRLIRVILRNA
ncbi:hypothetical protein AMATHDRAFT_3048 [Amanita thiersii Skay4041]|uniref:Uncharacterized protein n=1 Tax=Amanita thiersii Skay4041 TaxID=703135 RepID=A0A2A9NSZ8_9AGAR|nr:hypothetical protein AMATHDRAFT_3048 [Amanita thiersii Skay4041]